MGLFGDMFGGGGGGGPAYAGGGYTGGGSWGAQASAPYQGPPPGSPGYGGYSSGSPGGDPLNLFGTRGPFGGGDPSMGGGAFNQMLSGGNTPQQQGYGIGDAPPYAPYSTGPGMTGAGAYNPNFDVSGPGTGETYYGAMGGRYGDPTRGGDYWQQLQNQGRTVAPQHPGLDPYYSRARERTASDINNQLAARGMFGSTVGLGQLGDALGGLNAEQANREADYALRRSAQELDWTQGLGGLAMGADSGELARLNAGQQAALAAQQAREGRIGDLYGNQLGMADRLSQQYLDQINRMLQDDMSALEASMMAESGLALLAAQQGNQATQDIMDQSDWAFDKVLGGMTLGGSSAAKGLMK